MKNKNFTKKKKLKNKKILQTSKRILTKSKRNLEKTKRKLKKTKRNLTNKIGGALFNFHCCDNIIVKDMINNANNFITTFPGLLSDSEYLRFTKKILNLIPDNIRDKQVNENLKFVKDNLKNFLDTSLMKENIAKAFDRIISEKKENKKHDYKNNLFNDNIYMKLIICAGFIPDKRYQFILQHIVRILPIKLDMLPITIREIELFKYFKYSIDVIVYSIINDIL